VRPGSVGEKSMAGAGFRVAFPTRGVDTGMNVLVKFLDGVLSNIYTDFLKDLQFFPPPSEPRKKLLKIVCEYNFCIYMMPKPVLQVLFRSSSYFGVEDVCLDFVDCFF